jgi:hypothetical protein
MKYWLVSNISASTVIIICIGVSKMSDISISLPNIDSDKVQKYSVFEISILIRKTHIPCC